MTELLGPLLAGAAPVVAGCGTGGDVAVDGAGNTPAPSPHGTPSSHPSAAPWPAYPVDDYTYRLTQKP